MKEGARADKKVGRAFAFNAANLGSFPASQIIPQTLLGAFLSAQSGAISEHCWV